MKLNLYIAHRQNVRKPQKIVKGRIKKLHKGPKNVKKAAFKLIFININ